MILYLPLADNVGNEDAGAFPSPTSQATRVIRLPVHAVRDEITLKTRHQRRDLAIHASEAGRVR